jgi:hypothetical protein
MSFSTSTSVDSEPTKWLKSDDGTADVATYVWSYRT